MQRYIRIVLLTVLIGIIPAVASAQYTIVLKNGRRITTQAYREEGTAIRVFGLGGEFTIPRGEVQSILGAQEGAGRGLDLRERAPADVPSTESRPAGPAIERPAAAPSESSASPEELRAKEENDYRNRVQEITDRIKAVQDGYLSASRGTSTPEPTVLTGDDAIRRRTDDLNSRLRDTEHNPGAPSDAGPVRLESPSPFTGTPPAVTDLPPATLQPSVTPPPQAYTSSERQLSDLRNEMSDLIKQREKLIDEMKQKNFQTGNLFLQ